MIIMITSLPDMLSYVGFVRPKLPLGLSHRNIRLRSFDILLQVSFQMNVGMCVEQVKT